MEVELELRMVMVMQTKHPRLEREELSYIVRVRPHSAR